MRETWYDRSIEQLEHRFSTDRGSGLVRADIKKIRREYGANDIYPTPSSGFFGYRSHIFIDFASTLLFVAAILAAMAAAGDRLRPGNGELARLTALTSQLLQKRIAAMKTVDVGYAEVVRLPAQYYAPRRGKRAERRTSGGGEPAEKRNKL